MKTWKSVAAAFTIVVVVMGTWYYLGWVYPAKEIGSDAGPWGDQFGATTSLFTGFAMIGAIFAVILQILEHREEAKHRRASADDTHDDITLQALVAEINARSALLASLDEESAQDGEILPSAEKRELNQRRETERNEIFQLLGLVRKMRVRRHIVKDSDI